MVPDDPNVPYEMLSVIKKIVDDSTGERREEERREQKKGWERKEKEERGKKKENGKRKDRGNIVMEVRIEEIS